MLKQLLQHLKRSMSPEGLAHALPLQPPEAAGMPAPRAAPLEPLLLDVRSEREFAAASLQGSVHLPLAQVEALIDTLAPDRRTPLLVVCASGARSGLACQLLRAMGYADVTNVGGLYGAAARLERPLR